MNAWRDFKGGKWQDRIDVRDFIQKNYTPYTGDESFLQPPTARTEKMSSPPRLSAPATLIRKTRSSSASRPMSR